MTIWEALILGAVQGLTEFLPISSSGHLVLFQQLFGINEGGITFDVVIHMATLIAIIIFFGKSLLTLTKREMILIAIGTIPAVIVGVVLKNQIEALFANDKFIGLELIVTGLINFYTDRKLGAKTKVVDQTQPVDKDISPKNSFLIGIAQAVAIIPGISRSGSTVAAGVGLGLNREQAFRFSFLLAIPALAGAGLLEFVDVLQTGAGHIDLPVYALGALASFVTGLLSLFVFKYVMQKAKLEIFGWYCVILGLVVLGITFF